MSLNTKGKTKLANSMALLTSISLVVCVVLLHSLGAAREILMITSLASALYWVPIILNYRGLHVFSRVFQIVYSNILIFIMVILSDDACGYEYYYMVMIGLSLIFFDHEIGKWKWILSGITLPLWAASLIVRPLVSTKILLDPSVANEVGLMNNILQFLFLGAMFYFFSKISQEFVRKLQKQKVDLESANVELDKALAQANQSAESKDMFLANMSHEIRTPLNGVILASYMLLKSDLKDEQKEAANVICESGNNLMVIINDILDFSKIEANKMIVDKEPFDLRLCIQQVLNSLKLECSKKEIDLEFILDSSVPNILLGDKQRIRQVLTNLVGNAVKFTDEGKVAVRVDTKNSELPNHVVVVINVEDTGKGIASENIESIFDSFTQEDGSTNRTYGGTGLGTTISKMLVELMGGQIEAHSPNPNIADLGGPGSIFTFSLDLELSHGQLASSKLRSESEELTLGGQSSIELEETSINLKILVAEDNLINQKVASMLFEKLGYSIEIVENGQKAVIRAEEEDFDMIFMDYMMPVMDGLEATAILRSKNKHTPIIAMTANARERDRDMCLSVGMNDYMSKPVSVEKLHAIMEKWLPQLDQGPSDSKVNS